MGSPVGATLHQPRQAPEQRLAKPQPRRSNMLYCLRNPERIRLLGNARVIRTLFINYRLRCNVLHDL